MDAKARLKYLVYKNQDILPKVNRLIDNLAVDSIMNYAQALVTSYCNFEQYPDYNYAEIISGPNPITDLSSRSSGSYLNLSYNWTTYNISPVGATGSAIADSIQDYFDSNDLDLVCTFESPTPIDYNFGVSGVSGTSGYAYDLDALFSNFDHYSIRAENYGLNTITIMPVLIKQDISDLLCLTSRTGAVTKIGGMPMKEVDIITSQIMIRKFAVYNKYQKVINNNGVSSTSMMDYVCVDGLTQDEKFMLQSYRRPLW